MIEDQAINEQDDNKILHDVSDMFSLDQSELTEKLDQVERLCKEWKALFKKWPDVTKEQRNRINEILWWVANDCSKSDSFFARFRGQDWQERLQCRKEWELEQQEKEEAFEAVRIMLGASNNRSNYFINIEENPVLGNYGKIFILCCEINDQGSDANEEQCVEFSNLLDELVKSGESIEHYSSSLPQSLVKVYEQKVGDSQKVHKMNASQPFWSRKNRR